MEGGRVKKVQVQVKVLANYVKTSRFLEGIQNAYRHQHPNVVSLVAFCCDGGTRAVVREYPPETLFHKLYFEDGISLTWRQRMRIVVGVACGMDHLHSGAGPAKYYGELQYHGELYTVWNVWLTENLCRGFLYPWSVLLTDNLEAKLYYHYKNLFATKPWLNEKRDVSDFGFWILCHVITGRYDLKDEDIDFDLLSQMVDPKIQGTVPPEELEEVVSLARHCTLPSKSDRCSIRYAKEKLIECLRLEETPETAL